MFQISFLRSQCHKYLCDLYAFPLFVVSVIRWMRPGFEVVYEDVFQKARRVLNIKIVSR